MKAVISCELRRRRFFSTSASTPTSFPFLQKLQDGAQRSLTTEQSLEVFCQKLNDDRRGTLCSRLQTSYKLVQESESKRDVAPPEDRSRLQLVADAHFRALCRTFGQLCDLVKKSLQKLLLTELHWIHERCQTLLGC